MNEFENKNGGVSGPKNGLLNKPRKAISGFVYSAAVIAALVVSLIYSLALTAAMKSSGSSLDGFRSQDWYKYLNFLLPQVAYIAVISLFSFFYKAAPRSYGYRKTSVKYWLIALPLAFGLLFSLNWVNNLFVELLSKIGYTDPSLSDPSLTSREYALLYQIPSLAGGGFVGALFVIALLPAVCEETIFRGVILDGIKDIGTVAACLLGGLLFSIFHQNPAQTVYQFICGAVFTLIALRADSILHAVFMHFINNAVILFDYKFDFLSKISSAGSIAMYVVSGVCLVGSLVYLIFFDKKTNRKKEGAIKPFMLAALAGVILCGIMWISVLVDNMG